ncbi:hypothetical protein [Nonomuraea sp. SBT364]|uniref:hypothetical protein n=1 Tax=Nonomuraea sp. SBT364 TaxID=1580530 RepID=UPI00066C564B|nr:hypothetical protein [Nonomuraea sp. SBT364]
MVDILVGAEISADDFPPAVWDSDTTGIVQISSTTFIAGSPAVELNFTAPTSGTVILSVGMGGSDNGGTNRIHVAPEVRLTNVSGSVVLAADVTTRGVGTPGEVGANVHRSRTTLLTGLTAGQLYYARVLYKVSGGSTADIACREISVTPTPLGGSFAGRPVRALDFPPAAWAQNSTQINNPSNSGYITGTPEVSVTFTAPTSGRVLLIVGGALGNGAGGDRIFLSPEVRETNSSGDLVLSPSVTSRGFGSDICAGAFHYGSRESVLEGLTPGQLYYAVVKYAVATTDSGGSTQDIGCRDIGVVPIP